MSPTGAAGSARGRGKVQERGWRQAEWLLAAAGTILIAAQVSIQLQMTLGALLALATIPIWLPATRSFVMARPIMILALLLVPAGVILTVANSGDHEATATNVLVAAALVVGVVLSLGFLLWAREHLGEAWLAGLYGLGLLAGTLGDGALSSTNPWKFGISIAVLVLVLGLAWVLRSRWLELVLIAGLAAAATLADARSLFAMLLLTAAIVAWQLRGRSPTAAASSVRVLAGLGLLAAASYFVGSALILGGAFGTETQRRSLEQVETAGSLILGGRPELAATLALFREQPWGFGSGTLPSLHDIAVAKAGMLAINYNPDNGYVENFMFGERFALHSVLGDLWVSYGWVGLAFALTVSAVVLHRLGYLVSSRAASAVVVFVALRWLWNLFFGPWFSSLSLLVLLLALILRPRAGPDQAPLSSPVGSGAART